MHREDHWEVANLWHHLEGDIVVAPAVWRNEQDPGTGLGELCAVTYVLSVLQQTYPPSRLHLCTARTCDDCPQYQRDAHHIFLGGPDFNPMCQIWLNRHGVKLPYRPHEVYAPYVKWEAGRAGSSKEQYWWGTGYKPDSKVDPYNMTFDHGFIWWHWDDKTKRRTVFCIGGHTYGTYAAAVACFSGPFARAASEVRNSCFEALVRIEGIDTLSFHDKEHPISLLGWNVRTPEATIDFPLKVYNAKDLNQVLYSFFWRPLEEQRKKQHMWAFGVVAMIFAFLIQLIAALLAFLHYH
jgi:hypothetical protein